MSARQAVKDFNVRTGTPTRLIKGVVGALFVLGVYEHRHQIRAASVLLLQRLGILCFAKKRPKDTEEEEEGPPADEFEAAKRFAATANFPQEQKLQLYGLYKHVNFGVCDIPEPSRLYLEDHAKYTAWKAVQADSVESAKAQYVALVTLVHPEWAAGAAAEEAPPPKHKGMGPVSSTMAVEEVDSNDMDIMYWAGEGDASKVQERLDSGEAVDKMDEDTSLTSLMLASERGHLEVVQLLLARKCCVNLVNNDGDAALHMAMEEGRTEVAKVLLAHGADPNIENADGEKPAPLE